MHEQRKTVIMITICNIMRTYIFVSLGQIISIDIYM